VTGVTILEVTIDHRRRIASYEHTPEDQLFRTWLVPAMLINSHGQVRQLTEDEAQEAYFASRSRAEDATAEMFFREAEQEAEEAWATEQTMSLEEVEQESSVSELTSVGELLAEGLLDDEH
jgi:hypothetical protein